MVANGAKKVTVCSILGYIFKLHLHNEVRKTILA